MLLLGNYSLFTLARQLDVHSHPAMMSKRDSPNSRNTLTAEKTESRELRTQHLFCKAVSIS